MIGSPSLRPSIPVAGAPAPARLAIPVLAYGSNDRAAFAPVHDPGASGRGRAGANASPDSNVSRRTGTGLGAARETRQSASGTVMKGRSGAGAPGAMIECRPRPDSRSGKS